MKNIVKILIITFIPLILNASGGGSFYSRYGIGEISTLTNGRNLGMGLTGIASQGKLSISSSNPATWSGLQLVRFEAAMDYKLYDIEDKNGSLSFNETSFSNFAIGVPLHRDWGFSMVLGLEPVTDVQYDVSTKVENDISDYYAEFSGTGGLSKTYFGFSYKLPMDFILGAAVEYYSGTIEYSSEVNFVDDTDLVNGLFTKERKYHGTGFNIGIMTDNLSDVLSSELITDLRLGVSYNVVSDLDTDSTLTIGATNNVENTFKGQVFTKIPSSLKLGLNLTLSHDYSLGFEYESQDWSNYEYKNIAYSNLNNYSRIGVGFEYKNKDIDQYSSVWEQMALRAGFSFTDTQWKLNGQDIKQYALHAGFSFPMGSSSNIDIGFMAGQRGTTDFSLMKETIFKTTVTISFGELWFVRRDR